MKTQNNFSKILHMLVLMLASLAPVVADDVALLSPEETNCTVRVHQEFVFIKIRSSGTNDIINIYANGTYVAYCDTAAALMKPDFQDNYHVFLTHGACVFIIYNYDGNIFSVNITSEARKLTKVSVQGVPITNCFRPSSVVLNLKEKTNCDVRVHHDSVVFKIRSSDNGTIKIHANGTYVAYCHPEAALIQPDFKDNYHVSLTPRGSCDFIIYNYDGNIFSVNITSETRNLTEVSVQGVPITNCFRPSSVVLNLKGEEKCHQQGVGTVCKVGGVPVWAVVLIVILLVVLFVAAVLALWCGCKRAGMDQRSSSHGAKRHDKCDGVMIERKDLMESKDNRGGGRQDRNDAVNGKPGRKRQDSTKTCKGKPGRARQDSNEAVKGKLGRGRKDSNEVFNDTPERGLQDSNDVVNDKPGRGRQDSNDAIKGWQDSDDAVKYRPGRGRQDSNDAVKSKFRDTIGKNKKGKQQINRDATAKDGYRDKCSQQSYQISTWKTQRSFGQSELELRNRFKPLVDPV